MTTKSQFTQLLVDIEPSLTTKSAISAAHQRVRKFLREHPTFKLVHRYTFLTGSTARDTACRPQLLNGERKSADADIVVITNHGLGDSPKTVLKFLKDTLTQEFELDKDPHTRSVGILIGELELDVVILIAPPDEWLGILNDDDNLTLDVLVDRKLYIPDRKLDTWHLTNPAKQMESATAINKASNGVYKPLVKMARWWRRHNPTSHRHPKGFPLEIIVAECFCKSEADYEEAFLRTLEGIKSQYALSVLLNRVPTVADTGINSNSVLARLEFDDFKSFYDKVCEHATLGREAQADSKSGDEDAALEKWRKIFGSRFPSIKSLREAAVTETAKAVAAAQFGGLPIHVLPNGIVGTTPAVQSVVSKPHRFYGR